jgi:hypothetical protein
VTVSSFFVVIDPSSDDDAIVGLLLSKIEASLCATARSDVNADETEVWYPLNRCSKRARKGQRRASVCRNHP